MRILTFIEDLSWIDIFEYFYSVLEGVEFNAFTLDKNIAVEASKYYDKVFLYDSAFNVYGIQSALRKVLEGSEFDVILAPSSNKGRMFAGVYTGLTKCSIVTDVVGIGRNGKSFNVDRLVYGGTALATISLSSPFSLCVVKGGYKEKPKNRFGEIIKIDLGSDSSVEFRPREVTGNDPTSSDIVVVAGRGIKKKEDMAMIEELAGITGGAWSVTRPLAADYRWADQWIGISGLIISPKVYIGFGVSGQPHHMMGARASKYVIAVNKDPEAPIFEESDLGIIGDLYKILPRLLERLKKG